MTGDPPRICIYGAGAVGGHVAARLAAAGTARVSVVARGAHLEAIRQHGLHLRHVDGTQWHGRFEQATDDAGTLPPQDLVLVALKAGSLPDHAEAIGRLLADGGVAAFLVNGIPWWWNHGRPVASGPLPLLDPDGGLWREVRPERTLGTVVQSPNEVEAPGRIVTRGRSQFLVAEPDGRRSERLARVVGWLQAAGLPAEASDDLRGALWHKLAMNVAASPISALTRLDTAGRAAVPELVALGLRLAREIAAIAAASGHRIEEEFIERAARPNPAGSGRPSMLQDVQLGRRIEVEALLGQPVALARELGVPVPALEVVLPLLRGLDRALAAG